MTASLPPASVVCLIIGCAAALAAWVLTFPMSSGGDDHKSDPQ